MNGNQNDDDAQSIGKRFKTFDNGGAGPWSDLNHNVLNLIMMQLGVVDCISFRGVCKSWRMLAHSERNKFMESKPPMTMCISCRTLDKICSLKDFEGRKFNTILHSFAGGTCVGLTSGYLIFFKRKIREFWLVHPITRHQLYFKNFPIKCKNDAHTISGILVFSHSVSRWVFVVMRKCTSKIWFSIEGKGSWNHVSRTNFSFTDLRAFKGKIYALYFKSSSLFNRCRLYELRLNPHPNLMLLETKNSLDVYRWPELVISGENMYVMDRTPEDRHRFQELDFGEMKWVLCEKTIGQYASFLSNLTHGVADKPVLGKSRGQGLLLGHNTRDMLKLIPCSFTVGMWYFPHGCLNFDVIEE